MRKEDPDRKGFKPTTKEETTCLKCQQVFLSPDKRRIRICRVCKSSRTRSNDYNPSVVYQAPND